MASMVHQPFHRLFIQQSEIDEGFVSFNDALHNAFAPEPGMAMDVPYTTTSTNDTTMGFEPSIFADMPSYMMHCHTSPGAPADDGDMRLSSSGLSSTSMPSAPSSAVGSPQSNHEHLGSSEWSTQTINLPPGIVGSDCVSGAEYFANPGMEDFSFGYGAQPKSFVDPIQIHPNIVRPTIPISPFEGDFAHHAPGRAFIASPALSSSPQPNMLRSDSTSPLLHNGPFNAAYTSSPYIAPAVAPSGEGIVGGNGGGGGGRTGGSGTGAVGAGTAKFASPGPSVDYAADDTKDKQRCTYPDCGKIFKDLKAHMLTHQTERPEKCPIQTCEYHIKGFARKYDKNRHTLTHYKGTMVCGFCPGSGSSAEKSFNRADVFKRHLTAVHGVEQSPPNSRKKVATGSTAGKKLTGYAPDATGKCSTCSQTFSNAQEFYEHLDDCVLRIVQQEDPAEAINAKRLAEVDQDKEVQQTLEKNNVLSSSTPSAPPDAVNEDEDEDSDMGDDDDGDDDDDDEADDGIQRIYLSKLSRKKGNPAYGVKKSRGLTHSRGGVRLQPANPNKARGRKNRRDYPSSWGFDKGQMTMKKRVMAVFDGPRRLAKDDMMLSTEREVRIKLSDGKSYVTDLDVQTLKRAEGFLGATDEEKGPWISDDPSEEQLREMQEMLKTSDAASASVPASAM